VDCFQPGQICIFPNPEGEPGQLADLLARGDLPADFEGVETTFDDVLEANLAALERSESVSYGAACGLLGSRSESAGLAPTVDRSRPPRAISSESTRCFNHSGAMWQCKT
jgi:hypothetical protein